MKKYSFYELVTQPITIESIEENKEITLDGITIPMIQRDYAQGREDEYDIRVRFLKNIFQALQTDTEIELDFVYGSLTTIDKKTFFVPLDGQQRLTTLFLLYWYIGNRELIDGDLQKLRDALSRFTYETRVSSREFCGKLSQITCSFVKAPSIDISESFWFYESYRHDPTVKSMLVMLDAIHSMYSEKNCSFYSRLQKVTFYGASPF